ncbi:TPA: glycosyltransferase family 2 protein [Proteus mirabilis]|nr:glycosyltransferase family 2 protein [Proteus mirabilis]
MLNSIDDIAVSVIMPVFNGEKFMPESINSVLDQTFKNWELLIIDDHSTDNSYAIATEYSNKFSNIKVFKTQEKQSGASKARNIGILNSTKRFIAFLDCDDYWTNDKLEKQLYLLIKENAHFCYGSYNIFDGRDNKKLGTFIPSSRINYYTLLKGCDIGCLTVIYDTKFLGKCYFPNTVKEDYALWLQIAKKNDIRFILCKDIIAYYRISQNSLSSNKWKEITRQYKIYKDVEKLNIFQSSFYVISYVFYGVKKHYFNYRGKKLEL